MARIDYPKYRKRLNEITGRMNTQQEIRDWTGRDAFRQDTVPSQQQQQQRTGPVDFLRSSEREGAEQKTPKPGQKRDSFVDEIIKKNPDRDPMTIEAGVQQFRENMRRGDMLPPEKPITVDDLEKLGKQRIEQEQHGYLETIGKGLVRGTEGLASGVGSATRWLGEATNIDPLAEAGDVASDYWDEAAQEGWAAPDPYTFRGSFMDKPSLKRATGIVGEALPWFALSLIIGGAGAGAAARAGVPRAAQLAKAGTKGLSAETVGAASGAGTLGLLEGAPQYEEAREEGKGKLAASGVGAASTIGTAVLEALPISRILKRGGMGEAGEELAEGAFNRIWKGGTEEAMQEASQTVWQNSIAKIGYDDTRNLAEGIVESIIGGAGAGGIGGGVVGAGQKRAQKRAQEAIDKAKQQGMADEEIEALHQDLLQQIEATAGKGLREMPDDQLSEMAKEADRAAQQNPDNRNVTETANILNQEMQRRRAEQTGQGARQQLNQINRTAETVSAMDDEGLKSAYAQAFGAMQRAPEDQATVRELRQIEQEMERRGILESIEQAPGQKPEQEGSGLSAEDIERAEALNAPAITPADEAARQRDAVEAEGQEPPTAQQNPEDRIKNLTRLRQISQAQKRKAKGKARKKEIQKKIDEYDQKIHTLQRSLGYGEEGTERLDVIYGGRKQGARRPVQEQEPGRGEGLGTELQGEEAEAEPSGRPQEQDQIRPDRGRSEMDIALEKSLEKDIEDLAKADSQITAAELKNPELSDDANKVIETAWKKYNQRARAEKTKKRENQNWNPVRKFRDRIVEATHGDATAIKKLRDQYAKKLKPVEADRAQVASQKKQKELDEYNQFVESLTDDQKKIAGNLIKKEPKNPKGLRQKIERTITQAEKKGAKDAETIRKYEGQVPPTEIGAVEGKAPEGQQEAAPAGQAPPVRQGPGEGGQDLQQQAPGQPGGAGQRLISVANAPEKANRSDGNWVVRYETEKPKGKGSVERTKAFFKKKEAENWIAQNKPAAEQPGAEVTPEVAPEVPPWGSMTASQRHEAAKKAGWTNKKGDLTPTGKKIARSEWKDLSLAAQNVLQRDVFGEAKAEKPAEQPGTEATQEAEGTGRISPQKQFSPGDTAYVRWEATGKDEPVNFRGHTDEGQAVVVKDGSQMTVPVEDLKATPEEGEKTTSEQPSTEAAPEAAPEEKTAPTEIAATAAGKTAKAFLPDDTEISIRYAVADEGAMVTSHDKSLARNSKFPEELQPRARDRDAMRLQVERMANKLNPERLGESASVAAGAPVVGKDMVVESGNGRVIAIRKAYDGKQGEKYKQWLVDNAEKFGLNTETVEGMENPVLVRIRLTEVEDRAEFAKKANKAEVASMSPAETAKSDAEQLTEKDLGIFAPSEEGDITAASNRAFMSRFMEKLGIDEAAGYLTADGRYTKQFVDRVKSAIFYKAYQNDELVTLMAEEADPGVKNLLNALTVAAPQFVKARNANEKRFSKTQVADNILGAIKLSREAKDNGFQVEDYLRQTRLFEENIPEPTKKLALFIENNKRSAKRQGIMFKDVADQLYTEITNRENQSLPGMEFGDINILEVIDNSIQKVEALYAKDKEAGQIKLFGESEPGQGVSERGGEGQQRGYRRTSPGVAGTAGRSEEQATGKEGGTEPGRIEEPKHVKGTFLKQPSKADRPRFQQAELPFGEPRAESEGRVQDISTPARNVVMRTTRRIDAEGNNVSIPADAAALLSFLETSPQERAYVIATDQDGTVLQIHDYVKGARASGNISPIEVAAPALNIPETSHVYFIHNHPGGDVQSSPDDRSILSRIEDMLSLKNIGVTGLIVGGDQYATFTKTKDSMPHQIRNAIRKTTLPLQERTLKSPNIIREAKNRPAINNNETAIKYIQENYNGADGILFVSAKNKPLGMMPMPVGKPGAEGAAEVVEVAESLNARAMIIHSTKDARQPSRKRFITELNNLVAGDLTIHEVISEGKGIGQLFNLRRPTPEDAARRLGEMGPLYQRISTPPFYSELNRTVSEMDFKSMPAKDLLARIKKTQGIKQEELDWTGLESWLAERDGKVSKQEVMDYLAANQLEVQEVEKREGTSPDPALFETFETTDEDGTPVLRVQWSDLEEVHADSYDGGETFDLIKKRDFEATARNEEEARAFISKEVVEDYPHLLDEAELGDTRHSQYQVPGGENYREMLITLPVKYREETRSIYDPRTGSFTTRGEIIEENKYRSSHWQEPNVLAHVRMNDRTGPNGERVLLLEEVQADKGQEWRRLKKKVDDGTATKQEKDRFEFLDKNFPFNKTSEWPMLAMKRMVRYAAENGYDMVAWTPGEVQAERYDLSKQVDTLNYINDQHGNQMLTAFKDGRQVINEKNIRPEDLPDYIGKELTDRLLQAPEIAPGTRRIEGDNLKVGGHGMTAFYDKMLPSMVGKFFAKKKWGNAKVERTEILTDPEGGAAAGLSEFQEWMGRKGYKENILEQWRATGPRVDEFMKEIGGRPIRVHALPITGQMKKKALSEGMPLFQRSRQRPSGLKATDIKANLGPKISNFQNAPQVEFIQSEADLPQVIQNDIAFHKAHGEVAAVWYQGKVHFVADNLRNSQDAETAMLHEVFGHYGVEAVIPRGQAESYFLEVFRSKRGEAQRIANMYNLDTSTRTGKIMAAREVVAHMAQTGVEDKLLDRIVKMVRDGLRKIGLTVKLSDAEIRQLIVKGAKHVQGTNRSITRKPAEVGAPAYQIIAFHGSPHDVTQSPEGRFSTRYMGRGEGAHAFGWGLYFTDVGQVAKYYAQQSTEKGSRNLYQVSLHKGKDPSEYTWLDWYQPVPDEVTNKIADYIQKKGQADFAESFKKAVKQNNLDGRELYRELADFRGSEKDASLFLLDAGIDGIRYPSGTLSGVKVGEGNNYVVFDENAVTIEDHIQYSRRGPQTESEKNAAAMQQEQRLANAGMDRFRKFLNEMVDDRKGAINAGKWMKETGTRPPTMDPKDFPKYISSILTPYNFAQRDEQFRKLFEAEQNSKAFSHHLTAEDRVSTESYYDLKDKSKVNQALMTGDESGVEYKDSTLKNKFGLNEDEIAAYRAVRQALNDKLRRIMAGSISDDLMEQSGLGKEELADLAIKAASKEDLQSQLKEMGVDEDGLSKLSWLFDWAKQHTGYIPHKWQSEWRARIVADGETWMLDVPTVGGKVYPTRAGRQKAAQQNAIQVAKKRLGWSNERVQQAIENTQQMNELRNRRDNLNKRLDAEKNAKAQKQIREKLQKVKDQMEELEKQDQFLVIHHRDLPVDLFQDVDQGLVKNLAETATEAAWQDLEGDFSDKEYADRLKTAIRENVEKMYLAKGGLAHLIGRKGVKGYRQDIENVLAEYLTGVNSLIAKHEKARNFANAFKDINPTRTPEKWRYGKQYIEDMLGESHEAGWFKRVAGTWFLAADISAAALNFTQNYTHGVSNMRRIKPKRDKISAEREIHGAMRDVAKEYFDAKRKGRDMYRQASSWLAKDEVEAVRSAMDRGILDPAFLGEVTGFHRNAILDTRVIQEGLFKTFTGMEAMNRMSTFLAAYRRAKKARTGTEAEIEAGALEDALKIVDSSHFVYGRGNRPELIRKTGALGNVAFTFMTYPVNNLIWLKLNAQQTLEDYHRGDKEAVKRDMQVLGSNLGYLFGFGGMGAIPFIYLAQAAVNLFDDDNEDWETLMRRHTPKPVGRLVSKGLPAMLGNDFSFRVQGTDVFGAPIGFQIAGQLKRRAQTAAERWGQYEYGGAIFHLMPDFIRNPYRAYLGYTEGGEREGAPPIKYGAGEAAWRALGFSPTRESETYEATGAARKQYYRRLDKLENYAERYIAYQHNPAEINRLRQEVRQYNIEQRKKGDRGLPIPWKDVISSAKQRRTTRHKGYTERLPKYMEDYQKEVHQDYGLQ